MLYSCTRMAIVDVKGLKPTGGTVMLRHAAYPDSAWDASSVDSLSRLDKHWFHHDVYNNSKAELQPTATTDESWYFFVKFRSERAYVSTWKLRYVNSHSAV